VYEGQFTDPSTVHADCLNSVFDLTDAEWVMMIDSDMILHPLVLEKAEKMVVDLPDMGYGSVFNTEEHQDMRGVACGYVEKGMMGFCASIIRRDVWQRIGKPVDDIQFSNEVNALQLGIYCTEQSYAEHMGFDGQNKRGDTFIDTTRIIDRARRFMND